MEGLKFSSSSSCLHPASNSHHTQNCPQIFFIADVTNTTYPLGVSNLINSWPRKGCFWAENIISLNMCTNSGQKHFHGTTLVNEEFDHNLQGQHLGISL